MAVVGRKADGGKYRRLDGSCAEGADKMILTRDEMIKDTIRMLWESVDSVATPETRDEVMSQVLEAFGSYMFRGPIGRGEKNDD